MLFRSFPSHDIGPKAYPPHHQGILKALERIDFNSVQTRGDAEGFLGQYISEKSVIQFLLKNLYWTEDKNLNWRFNLKTLSEKYNDFVANAIKFGTFNGKTLFISGEKSNYILPQDELLIRQQFPNFQLVTIPNAGHWVQAENPVDFTNTVKN